MLTMCGHFFDQCMGPWFARSHDFPSTKHNFSDRYTRPGTPLTSTLFLHMHVVFFDDKTTKYIPSFLTTKRATTHQTNIRFPGDKGLP